MKISLTAIKTVSGWKLRSKDRTRSVKSGLALDSLLELTSVQKSFNLLFKFLNRSLSGSNRSSLRLTGVHWGSLEHLSSMELSMVYYELTRAPEADQGQELNKS